MRPTVGPRSCSPTSASRADGSAPSIALAGTAASASSRDCWSSDTLNQMVKRQLVGRSAAGLAEPRLYVIPGSHACRATMLMLEHKGLSWRPFEFVPGMQTIALRPLGFPGRTVPALRFDGSSVQGNRNIARFLD